MSITERQRSADRTDKLQYLESVCAIYFQFYPVGKVGGREAGNLAD